MVDVRVYEADAVEELLRRLDHALSEHGPNSNADVETQHAYNHVRTAAALVRRSARQVVAEVKVVAA